MTLEEGVEHVAARPWHVAPRATCLVAVGEIPGLKSSVWMGGAESHVGEEMRIEAMGAVCVIDAAGDMPVAYRHATGLWMACVFPDLDSVPIHLDRIHQTVWRAIEAMRKPHEAPSAVYAVCQHGMNRSGLLAGLLLRHLGMSGPDAVALITSKRPGSLSNQAFRRLILQHDV